MKLVFIYQIIESVKLELHFFVMFRRMKQNCQLKNIECYFSGFCLYADEE
jgi:hypothetical protein